MEVEVRAQVDSKTGQRFRELAGDRKHLQQRDSYFVNSTDPKRLAVFRIRETDNKCTFTIKGTSQTGHANAWPEWETPLDDPLTLESVLLAGGFNRLLVIKKKRLSLYLEGFEVNLDEVEELGYFIEAEAIVEGETHEQITKLKRRLEDMLKKTFDITQESFINLGYVDLLQQAQG